MAQCKPTVLSRSIIKLAAMTSLCTFKTLIDTTHNINIALRYTFAQYVRLHIFSLFSQRSLFSCIFFVYLPSRNITYTSYIFLPTRNRNRNMSFCDCRQQMVILSQYRNKVRQCNIPSEYFRMDCIGDFIRLPAVQNLLVNNY